MPEIYSFPSFVFRANVTDEYRNHADILDGAFCFVLYCADFSASFSCNGASMMTRLNERALMIQFGSS